MTARQRAEQKLRQATKGWVNTKNPLPSNFTIPEYLTRSDAMAAFKGTVQLHEEIYKDMSEEQGDLQNYSTSFGPVKTIKTLVTEGKPKGPGIDSRHRHTEERADKQAAFVRAKYPCLARERKISNQQV